MLTDSIYKYQVLCILGASTALGTCATRAAHSRNKHWFCGSFVARLVRCSAHNGTLLGTFAARLIRCLMTHLLLGTFAACLAHSSYIIRCSAHPLLGSHPLRSAHSLLPAPVSRLIRGSAYSLLGTYAALHICCVLLGSNASLLDSSAARLISCLLIC